MTVPKYFEAGGEGSYVAAFCHAGPDTWYAYSYGDGGGGSGPCSVNDPVSPPPPDRDLGARLGRFAPEPLPVRMFVFKPTKAQLRCLHRIGLVRSCRIGPAASTDATFGFAIHEHRANRWVLQLGEDLGFDVLHLEDPLAFEALAIQDGREYLIEKAVVPAPASRRVLVRLDASDRERLVGVFSIANKREQKCFNRYLKEHRLPGSGESAERTLTDQAAKFCSVEYALKVDGTVAPESAEFSEFGDPWMHVPVGAREVTINVVRGDPRNERLAVVIWKARP